jgi:hypothetical protein
MSEAQTDVPGVILTSSYIYCAMKLAQRPWSGTLF